jgi:hypothetical protein
MAELEVLEDEQDEDNATTDGTETDASDTDEWKPPTRQDWDNVQEALRKARRDARAARRAAPKDGAEPNGGAPDAERLTREATSAAEARYKPLVVKAAARAAFAEAGIKGDAVHRVVRLLELEDLDVDEDGSVTGLTEQIEEIKQDFPELFAVAAPATRRTPKVDGAGRAAPSTQPKSSAERIASLFG